MKKLDPTSWHYKLYVFMSQYLAAWMGESDFHTYPQNYSKNIGLCPYMRMIFIWGPIAILSNLIPLAAIFVAFLITPVGINGIAGLVWLISLIVFIVVLIWIFAKLSDAFAEKLGDGSSEKQIYKQHSSYQPPVTFWSLLKEWVASKKSKICPTMELPDD